ncbi:hypothetical protein FDP41_001506 [Naegleria fowleri]|uniref:Globin-sensor domain-containing protein n=1 Tax=Naegleria fowleri TaxID=5763 RepID=A0A6A5BMC5_NAEFO|nr:uncharacterized protein FDP41_001506 [Naegleria fowleri]KAF0979163.1 hypothetical protein FDP41_001506 [Naegleria fowleri]CAG4712512.1 unnamed protein product [Naegleria fowleri]
MCEFISDSKLFVDPTYRYSYLLKFIKFGKEDLKLVKDFGQMVLNPLIPSLVEEIQKKMTSYDVTRELVLLGHVKQASSTVVLDSSDEHDIATSVTNQDGSNSNPHNEFIFKKEIQILYLKKLFMIGETMVNISSSSKDQIDPSVLNYIKELDEFCQLHFECQQMPVVHLSAYFGLLSDLIMEEVFESQMAEALKKKTWISINKLFWIQNDSFTKSHVDDAFRHLTSGACCPVTGAFGSSCMASNGVNK